MLLTPGSMNFHRAKLPRALPYPGGMKLGLFQGKEGHGGDSYHPHHTSDF